MIKRPSLVWDDNQSEYVLEVPPWDEKYMGLRWKLQEELQLWAILQRDDSYRLGCLGERNDTEVYAAVFRVVGAFDITLPTLDVLDQDGDIINCAILRERADCWDVKPVEGEEFDAKEWHPVNTSFYMAHWRIAKSDLSAQPSDKVFFTGELHSMALEQVMSSTYLNYL